MGFQRVDARLTQPRRLISPSVRLAQAGSNCAAISWCGIRYHQQRLCRKRWNAHRCKAKAKNRQQTSSAAYNLPQRVINWFSFIVRHVPKKPTGFRRKIACHALTMKAPVSDSEITPRSHLRPLLQGLGTAGHIPTDRAAFLSKGFSESTW
jgi:hypothetical protein